MSIKRNPWLTKFHPRTNESILRPLIEVKTCHQDCLYPKNLINDEIINAYFRILERRSQVSNIEIYCFDTFFFEYAKRSFDTFFCEFVKRNDNTFLTEKVDMIFFPLRVPNEIGQHWSLIVFDFFKKSIVNYDSTNHFYSSHVHVAIEFVQKWLGNKFNTNEWDVFRSPENTLRQNNDFDCGIYIMVMAEEISRIGHLERIPFDVVKARMSIARAIRRGKIGDECFRILEPSRTIIFGFEDILSLPSTTSLESTSNGNMSLPSTTSLESTSNENMSLPSTTSLESTSDGKIYQTI